MQFFCEYAALTDAKAFKAWLTPLRQCEWVVYAKRPFAGPQAVLAYLSRYTHRVAISNSRLIAVDEHGVTFKWKDYRVKDGAKSGNKGMTRNKTMTLGADEFIRRFLLHVLPCGLHRIRHYGLLANASRKASLALLRTLLGQPNTPPITTENADSGTDRSQPCFVCAHCGAAMIILQSFTRGQLIRAPPDPAPVP